MFSDRGAEQGDPLGPVYCAAVLSIVLERVRVRLEADGISLADAWYMDDGQLLCQPQDADRVLHVLDEESSKVGAERGRGVDAKSVCRLLGSEEAKNRIYSSWHTDYILASSTPIPDNDLEGHVLGINFDDSEGFDKQFLQAVVDVTEAREKVNSIDHVPCELAVVQSCLSVVDPPLIGIHY